MDTSLLRNACAVGDIDVVKDLLSRGVGSTECNEHHETAFHVACKSPKCALPVLEYMVKVTRSHDLDIYRDEEGRTPLHTALYSKKRDFALYLIKNRYCSSFAVDQAQMTPLRLACLDENVVVVRECCRQVHERIQLDQDECHELVRCMEVVQEKDPEILSSLCKCVGYEQLFTVLIENRKDALAQCLVNRRLKFKDTYMLMVDCSVLCL